MYIKQRNTDIFQNIATSSGGASASSIGLVAPEGQNIVGSLHSSTGWGNSYGFGNSSSGPWTTMYTYDIGTGNSSSTIQAWNMLTGDGFVNNGSSQPFYVGDMMGHGQRVVSFSNGNRIGHMKDVLYYSNSTSYAGRTFRVIPIRNTTSTSITRGISFEYSNYWSSGYEGWSVAQFTPNSSRYSGTTAGSWVQLSGSSSGGSGSYTNTGTVYVTIPANTTILLMLSNTHCYFTTYRFIDTNQFYNLNTMFVQGDPSIICDMRILSALQQARPAAAGYTSESAWTYYVAAASMFGDR